MSTLESLLAALGAAPVLPGARCRNRAHLFDPAAPGEDPDTTAARHAQAVSLCQNSCPALDRCRDWYESLPARKRPEGVVAGKVRKPRTAGRPRKEIA